jgi:chromosome segregation ATPase
VKVTQSGAVLTAARANLEAESLATKVRDLESTLEVERIRREAAEQRSADLEQSLVDLREVIAKLPKALEPAVPRRRWFKKS